MITMIRSEPRIKRRDGSYSSIEKLRGFLNYQRNPEPYRRPLDRIMDWEELNPVEGDSLKHTELERKVQAARCIQWTMARCD
jgi:glutamate synthase (NADPH/NADH) small chain